MILVLPLCDAQRSGRIGDVSCMMMSESLSPPSLDNQPGDVDRYLFSLPKIGAYDVFGTRNAPCFAQISDWWFTFLGLLFLAIILAQIVSLGLASSGLHFSLKQPSVCISLYLQHHLSCITLVTANRFWPMIPGTLKPPVFWFSWPSIIDRFLA